MSGKPQLDFDVMREPWNKYQVSDGAYIKTKIVVTKIKKTLAGDKQWEYSFDTQSIVVTLSDVQGTPDPKVYTPAGLQAAIIQHEMRYTIVSEEWNEYVVDDGTRLRLKSTVTRIEKTSLFDNTGAPRYIVELNYITQVSLPRP